MKKIAVAVVSFNGEKWLDTCISSVQNNVLSTDLFIWDNNSSDSSKHIINKYKNIKYAYFSEKNIGFGQANNYLLSKIIHEGVYDYCLLLNQDAWLSNNTLSSFVELIPSFREFTVICPLHITADSQAIEKSLLYYLKIAGLDQIINAFPANINSLQKIYSIPVTNAAAWFLKLEDISKLGLFDPLFFFTAEDTDFCSRLKYHNFRMGISPKINVIHDSCTPVETVPLNTESYAHSHSADIYIRAKDISYPFVKGVFSSYAYIAKHLSLSIMKVQLWRFYLNLKLLIRFTLDLKKILDHRKKSKKLNGPFLFNLE
jgi:GT2 family glycosyltransferase